MGEMWSAKVTGGRIVIDVDKLSDLYAAEFGDAIDALAEQVSYDAHRIDSSAAIGHKGWREINSEVAHKAVGDKWPVATSNPYVGSLVRKLKIPVALVFNNSKFAYYDEFGSTRTKAKMPLRKAMDAARGRGVRKVGGRGV